MLRRTVKWFTTPNHQEPRRTRMSDSRIFYILLSMVLMAGCSSRSLRNFNLPGDNVVEDNYSMSSFIPPDFIVPEKLETKEFRLRMLSIDDVDKDFEAVTSSSDHLSKVWPETGWPAGLTLRQNLIDLGWHEKEFQNRTSFAYTMVTLDESKVLGCVYFFPSRKASYDVEIFMWVRASELAKGLDQRLFDVVQSWTASEWPFKNPAYPGRSISWENWRRLPGL